MATKESLTLRKAYARNSIIESTLKMQSAGLKFDGLPDKSRDKDLEITRLLEYTASVLIVASDEILRNKEDVKKTTKKGKK